MTNPTLLQARAMAFSAARHSGQHAEGMPERPFLEHLVEVATLVAEATSGNDPSAVAAALLHEVLARTETTHAELVSLFGQEIAAAVVELSDETSLAEDERRRRQSECAPTLSARAKIIRLADSTSNLWALASETGDSWPRDRRRAYLAWIATVAAACRGLSAFLDQAFDEAAAAFAAAGEGQTPAPSAASQPTFPATGSEMSRETSGSETP
jgi:(p)ppGpp synthase/HD superfamily hydrolase